MIIRTSIGAFLINQESKAAIEQLKEDRIFLRSTFDVQDGGIDQAARHLAENPAPELIVVETSAQGDALFDQLNNLADVCPPGIKVILIGAQNDIRLYQELTSMGIGEYLVHPTDVDQLRTSITRVCEGVEVDAAGRVIAFFGVAGGVGSSILAHNTGNELVNLYDKDVIIVDLDICYGTGALVFNMQPRQTVVDALTQTAQMDEMVMEQYLAKFGEKLSLLPAPASLGLGYHVNGEALDRVLKVLRNMTDFLILDLPHLWEAWVPEILAGCDDLVLVCKPDLTNLRNAKNLLEYIGPKREASAPTRLIFNQVGSAKKTDLGDKDFQTALAKEPTLSIPFDPDAFGRALNNGELMSKASAKSKATLAIVELAKIISGLDDDEEEGGKKKGFSFLKGKKK